MCACMGTGGDGNTITKGCLYSCQAIRTHNTLTSACVVRAYAMETLSVCVRLELVERASMSTVGMVWTCARVCTLSVDENDMCVCVVAWCSYTQGQRCYTMFSGSPGQ